MEEEINWCPQAAMKAYLSTLDHLYKVAAPGGEGEMNTKAVAPEPEFTEFISALAAGNGAQLIVEIAFETTPLTLALAVAAKQTGGQFICILPTHHQLNISKSHVSLRYPQLNDAVSFVSGDPCEIMASLNRHPDFVVINDCEFEEHLRLLEVMMMSKGNANGRGSVVVERLGRSSRAGVVSFGEAVRGKNGVESVSLPLSGGVELTRINNGGKRRQGKADGGTSCGKVGSRGRRRCGRFHVIVENM